MHPLRTDYIPSILGLLDKSKISEMLKDNSYLLFVFKKAERIVAACYLITGLFPTAEPLRWEIRMAGTSLIKDTLSFTDLQNKAVEWKQLLAVHFARLVSLLEVARIAELISPMNFGILRKEIEHLYENILSRDVAISSVAPSFTLGEELFAIPKSVFVSEGHGIKTRVSANGLSRRGVVRSLADMNILHKSSFDYKGQQIKDTVLDEKDTAKGQNLLKDSISVRASVSDKKTDEREMLVGILKAKGVATINDFSDIIVGCSEKTVQRRLGELIRTGVVKRVGERRWSKYSLCKNT